LALTVGIAQVLWVANCCVFDSKRVAAWKESLVGIAELSKRNQTNTQVAVDD